MSEDGWAECCFEILVAIGLVLLIEWCEENPPCGIVVGVAFLGGMMVGLPIYWFIKESRQTIEGRVVVGYFLGFFIWIMAMIVGVVTGFSAILGFLVFLGIGIAGLMYLVIRAKLQERKKPAARDLEARDVEDQAASELGYGLMELKEQLGRGAITLEEYERKKMSLEGLAELKLQLGRGDITFEEYHQRKKKLLEKSEA